MIITNAIITKYTELKSFTDFQGTTQQNSNSFIGTLKAENEIM